MKKSNRIRGLNAYKSGDLLESILKKQFKIYKKLAYAYIDKYTDEKIIQKLEIIYLKHIYTHKLRVDFTGYTKFFNGKKLPTSVFVGIEAKQSTKKYFQYSLIKPHQLDYLYSVHKVNGIAFLVIGFVNENKIIRLNTNKNIYNMINSTISHNGTFSKGIHINELISIAGKNNLFDYSNPDILKLLSKE